MRKIISLFQRNYEGDHLVRNEIVPGAEWVINGEGIGTRKWDGTCCRIREGVLYKRYDAKKGKTPPSGFEPAQDPDPITGHWPGWIRVDNHAKEDTWFRAGFANTDVGELFDGTYELAGPRINGNPERLFEHMLLRHGGVIVDAPRTFNELREWFKDQDIEGVVWHHEDGCLVKIKTKDFGLKRSSLTT